MAVGDTAVITAESYLGIGRETAFGTYVTGTAGIDFLSTSIKTMKDAKILQEVSRKRTMVNDFRMGKTVEGDIQFVAYPDMTAMGYMLENAFGAAPSSATATGETAGGSAFTHTFSVGNMEGTYKALSVNMRKGGSSNGKTFRYSGGRHNTFHLQAQLDEPVLITSSLIFKDSTQLSDDIESVAMTATSYEPLSFVNGRLSIEGTFASLTSSSYWYVQSIDWTMNNNLKSDTGSRRIGSDTVDVLPPGVLVNELSCTMRFNTTTAYDAMIASTQFGGEFEFKGSTLSTSSVQRGFKVQFPKLTIKDAGDPEISGPDGVLTSTVTFNVLRSSGASGYAVRALLTNAIANYS